MLENHRQRNAEPHGHPLRSVFHGVPVSFCRLFCPFVVSFCELMELHHAGRTLYKGCLPHVGRAMHGALAQGFFRRKTS
jgi:hypothetical protein